VAQERGRDREGASRGDGRSQGAGNGSADQFSNAGRVRGQGEASNGHVSGTSSTVGERGRGSTGNSGNDEGSEGSEELHVDLEAWVGFLVGRGVELLSGGEQKKREMWGTDNVFLY